MVLWSLPSDSRGLPKRGLSFVVGKSLGFISCCLYHIYHYSSRLDLDLIAMDFSQRPARPLRIVVIILQLACTFCLGRGCELVGGDVKITWRRRSRAKKRWSTIHHTPMNCLQNQYLQLTSFGSFAFHSVDLHGMLKKKLRHIHSLCHLGIW